MAKIRLSTLLFATMLASIALQSLVQPSPPNLLTSGLAICVLAAVFGSKRNGQGAIYGAMATFTYITFLLAGRSLTLVFRYLSYDGKRPFFDDGPFEDLVLGPAIILVSYGSIAGVLGMMVGFVANFIVLCLSNQKMGTKS
jgi:hypothetical protein